ncbi:MAG: isoprenylcysteine carboxylmethyltransferase family protein [Chitinophagaceae bacterium]
MIAIGNFFFRYRNMLFFFLYAALFIPAPDVFKEDQLGPRYYYWPIILGLAITVMGQLIRGATIGLAYIIRGGREGKVYAEELVTQGIFNHCRNPLYLGNILMLLGVGILSNSLLYLTVFIPLFLLIYHAIVLAEENFLRSKFGSSFELYCRKVNRWIPDFNGLGKTFESMEFRWKRWILKEYNTQYVWLSGIVLILLLSYPQLTDYDANLRNSLLAILLSMLLLTYILVRYLKKSGKWQE